LRTEPLDMLPLWTFFVGTLLLAVAAVEGGLRLGRYRRRMSGMEKEQTVGPIVGATMGLLAFMLAFTFGLAATRFDARRKTVVDEANAVGTTYLRAGLLDDAPRSEVRTLLRSYVDGRLRVLETGDIDALLAESSDIHGRLWAQAENVGRGDPRSITVGLFIESLNEMIDLHSSRILIALQSRVPIVLWLILYLTALLSMLEIGYQAGLSDSRRSPATFAMIICFSLVLLLIADLDRPREGFVRVNQSAFLDLQQAWRGEGEVRPTP